MRALRNGIGLVLVVCLTTRLASELISPALPLVLTVFVAVWLVNIVFGGTRRW